MKNKLKPISLVSRKIHLILPVFITLVLLISHSCTRQKASKEFAEMIFVAGGTFTMGCTSEQTDCADSESPAHQVNLDNFYIGKYEVTQQQWFDVMKEYPVQSKRKDCKNCPVENVSWNEIQEFLTKLNKQTGKKYRLPTEAEWEYAARGGRESKKYKYSGSNDMNEIAWYWKNSGDSIIKGKWDWDAIHANNGKTHPVGTKKANELGIYDMTGNVGEWCQDWYDPEYYSKEILKNPLGANTGSNKVNRGGGWFSDARYSRVSDRHSDRPEDRFNFIGFRLAHSK